MRNDIRETVGGLKVLQFRDYRENKLIHTGSDEVQETGLPKSNVLYFELVTGTIILDVFWMENRCQSVFRMKEKWF